MGLIGDSADVLLNQLVVVSDLAISVFKQHGLSLNFSAGKIEAAVVLASSGATQARQALARSTPPNSLEIPGRQDILRVVKGYKHLGCMIESAAASRAEAVLSTKSARQAFHPLAGRVLVFTKISRGTRLLCCGGHLVEASVQCAGMDASY